MTQIFKKSLMMVAMVAAIAAAQVGVTHAQIDDALIISGQTIASVDDIVVNDVQAAAYYDPATGDVILSLGTNLNIFGIVGDFNFANFDQSAGLLGNPAVTGSFGLLSLTDTAITLPPIPSGVFNIGNILSADPSITSAADFQNAAFGGVAFQFGIKGETRGDLDFNVIAPVIPEPGSLSLLALAGLGVVARRRR